MNVASRNPHETSNPDVGCAVRTRFRLSKPHQRRRRKPPTNPLLPLRPNRHPKRDDRQGQQFIVDRQLHRLGPSEKE